MEQIAIWHEGDPLAPRQIAGGKVRLHLFGRQEHSHGGQQLRLHRVRLLEATAGELGHVEVDLAAHNLVDPGLVDLELTQGVGELVGVAGRDEIGRRALQQRQVLGVRRHGRGKGRSGRARPDYDHPLTLVVEVRRPGLGMDDPALERRRARPFRGVALRMAKVALAHPEEVGGDPHRLSGGDLLRLDGPEVVGARPAGAHDPVAVADVAIKVVLLDHLAHVAQDFLSRGDRRAYPRLEPIAEGVEVAVGADAGVFVSQPGAAKALLGLQDDIAAVRALGLQVVGRTDAGDTGSDDQHVEVLGHAGLRLGRRRALHHRRLTHRHAPWLSRPQPAATVDAITAGALTMIKSAYRR